MVKSNNITQITNNALCTACGACTKICPSKAIEIITNTAGYLVASLNEDLCSDCGKCSSVCPSYPDNQLTINCGDIFHGRCLAGYVGYASDKSIRHNSQSGGIVTALLCYLLDKYEIEGAIVNTFDPQTRRPKAIFASSRSEIVNASGSYYAQTSVVKTILEHSEKRIAAVVLGCQAESIKLIRDKFPDINLPKYTIGLICAGQYSGYMIDDLIEKCGCTDDRILKFRFRDKLSGWPGDVHITTLTKDYWLPKEERHMLKIVYELHRCIACFDQMNIFSDIVCGDPWGIINKQRPEGHTVIIARNENGKKLLENAARDGAIVLENLPVDAIMAGQTVDGRHKTKYFSVRDIFREEGWMFPGQENNFKNIVYNNANKKTLSLLVERLHYSRNMYFTTNVENYLRKVQLKKEMMKKKFLRRGIKKMTLSIINIIKKYRYYYQ